MSWTRVQSRPTLLWLDGDRKVNKPTGKWPKLLQGSRVSPSYAAATLGSWMAGASRQSIKLPAKTSVSRASNTSSYSRNSTKWRRQ